MAHRTERPGRTGRPSLRRRSRGCRRRRTYRPNPVVRIPQHTTRAFQLAETPPPDPSTHRSPARSPSPAVRRVGKHKAKPSVRPARGCARPESGRTELARSGDAGLLVERVICDHASGRGQPVKGRTDPTLALHMTPRRPSKQGVCGGFGCVGAGWSAARQSGTRCTSAPTRPIGRPAACTHDPRHDCSHACTARGRTAEVRTAPHAHDWVGANGTGAA